MVRIAEKLSKNTSPTSEGLAAVGRMVEDIVGCKWSLYILDQIRTGTSRPGAIVRSHPKFTTKVMNERLSKMVRFGILLKRSFPEVPPRVEYHLTPFGRRFNHILQSIERLQQDLAEGTIDTHTER